MEDDSTYSDLRRDAGRVPEIEYIYLELAFANSSGMIVGCKYRVNVKNKHFASNIYTNSCLKFESEHCLVGVPPCRETALNVKASWKL